MAFAANSATGGFGGATPATGGFGGATPATGGFGGATPATGGFGAKPATGGFGAKPATGGFGGATPATGGFGSATPATGGFGGATPATGGFGGATPATGGFGAKPATGGFGSATPATGGFGAASMSGGFGGPRSAGGWGLSTAGGGLSSAAPASVPYPGVKGPGYSTDWSRATDCSAIDDRSLFEKLPPPLQQHIFDLLAFMESERTAVRSVSNYLNDVGVSDRASYQHLVRRIEKLKGGTHAIDAVSVDCQHRDRDVQQLVKSLDGLDAEIRVYEQQTLGPLLEHDVLKRSAPQSRAGNAEQNTRALPFFHLMEELWQETEIIAGRIAELEVALVPNASRNVMVGKGAPERHNRFEAFGHSSCSAANTSINSGAPPTGRYMDARSTLTGEAGRGSAPRDFFSQVTATLQNELSAFVNLSGWASRLHARSEVVREVFASQYGSAEAAALFTQSNLTTGRGAPMTWSDSGERGPSAHATTTEYTTLADMHRAAVGLPTIRHSGPETNLTMHFDIELERRMQQHQSGSSATGFGVKQAAGAPATGFGATPATGAPATGFGATPATGAPATGFGATPATGAPATGFGATPATGAPATGFGATPATGAPATGFGATPATGAPATGFGATPATGAPATGFGAKPAAGAPATGFGATATTDRRSDRRSRH